LFARNDLLVASIGNPFLFSRGKYREKPRVLLDILNDLPICINDYLTAPWKDDNRAIFRYVMHINFVYITDGNVIEKEQQKLFQYNSQQGGKENAGFFR